MTDFGLSSLIRRETDDMEHLPKGVFVYGLFRDQEIIYIGSTKNIEARLSGHSKKPWNRLCLIRVRSTDRRQVEHDLIQRYKPSFNKPRTFSYCLNRNPVLLVRLENDVTAAIKKSAKKNARSVPKEVNHVLREQIAFAAQVAEMGIKRKGDPLPR